MSENLYLLFRQITDHIFFLNFIVIYFTVFPLNPINNSDLIFCLYLYSANIN